MSSLRSSVVISAKYRWMSNCREQTAQGGGRARFVSELYKSWVDVKPSRSTFIGWLLTSEARRSGVGTEGGRGNDEGEEVNERGVGGVIVAVGEALVCSPHAVLSLSAPVVRRREGSDLTDVASGTLRTRMRARFDLIVGEQGWGGR